ncbi:MAG TPA: tetratricopeptide repeat protein, partial [Vicinamibacterales bacterium]
YGGAGDRALVLHEYAHHVLRRSVRPLPLWLNEGLAEFYSTFDHDTRLAPAVVGRPPAQALAVLRSSPLLPLAEILETRSSSALLQDLDRARVFYAESWALVHYLTIGRPGASPAQLGALADALARAVPPDDAFRFAFEMSLDDADRELRNYVRREVFDGAPIYAGPRETYDRTAHQLAPAALAALRGELLLRVGSTAEANAELASAIALDPANVPARIAIARVLMVSGHREEGRAALERVVAAAPGNFTSQYFLGAALAVERRYEDAFWCFDAAVRLRPASVPALYAFSSVALAIGLEDAAEEAMQLSMRLEFNPEAYRARAYAALGLRRDSAAARDALRYIDSVGWRDPAAQETALVAAVAYSRSARPCDAAAILDRVRQSAGAASWPAAVAEFLQGSLPADRLMARANTQAEQTDAHTYIGLRAMLAGHREEALAHFRWVKESGSTLELEFGVAIEEFVRLGAIERR